MSEYLRSSVRKYNVRHRLPNPAKAVLMVIDMQEYFRGMAEPILPEIKRMIASCHSAGVPIVYTYNCHSDPHDPQDGRMLAEWWGSDSVMMEGTKDVEIMPEVASTRQPSDLLIRKRGYSSFVRTDVDLEKMLREWKREEVIVCGVMTNLCCETAAREAFVRGFRVFFSIDGTATSNDDLHISTLKNLAHGFAYLVNAAQVEKACAAAAALASAT
ncbi:hypothetical protein CBR_g16977 [Chara braunii]|uniref:Isochorismatase-like domain-containing protein n=1 Tax=Chara braunii TaxID=69332 RepID=A0A388KU92_CHABU|nr:hypothetical protein CBR_g16977 [Chara braunii]|eukprot:GBG73634.1 hypothetical protein CBR_g16977 [Chara braunii]